MERFLQNPVSKHLYTELLSQSDPSSKPCAIINYKSLRWSCTLVCTSIYLAKLLTPILKLYESLFSLSKDPFTVITPLLGRIMNTLPGFVSERKNNHTAVIFIEWKKIQNQNFPSYLCRWSTPPEHSTSCRHHSLSQLLHRYPLK